MPISANLRASGFHLILPSGSRRLTMHRETQMSGRRSKLFIALLAVALNVVSAPMAWARMSASFHRTGSSAMSGMEHCAGHVDASNSKKAGSPQTKHGSCCNGGSCTCGCVPVAMVAVIQIQTTTVAPAFAAAESKQAFPAKPFEDPLRPPIS